MKKRVSSSMNAVKSKRVLHRCVLDNDLDYAHKYGNDIEFLKRNNAELV